MSGVCSRPWSLGQFSRGWRGIWRWTWRQVTFAKAREIVISRMESGKAAEAQKRALEWAEAFEKRQ